MDGLNPRREGSSGPRRARSIAVLSAGLLVAVVTPLGWWATHHPSGASASPDIGRGTATALAAATAPVLASTPAVHPSARTVDPTPPAAPIVAPAPPIRVRIAAIGVDAPIVSVGVDERGDMQIPEQISQVGWYRWSSLPGAATGSTVLAGHVDSAVQGLGALFRLRDVPAGTTITLMTTDGRAHNYRVVGREEFPKSSVPLDAIFSHAGRARLTIVTCGGRFDAIARSYEDNVVLTAVPL